MAAIHDDAVRAVFVIAIGISGVACGHRLADRMSPISDDIVLLTRSGCPTTAVMRVRLEEALTSMSPPASYHGDRSGFAYRNRSTQRLPDAKRAARRQGFVRHDATRAAVSRSHLTEFAMYSRTTLKRVR
jgi:hypothetical protein